MSCVWVGILQALKKDYLTCQDNQLKNKILNLNTKTLVQLLKFNNNQTNEVKWNSVSLTKKQLIENLNHINEIKENNINLGYECGTCDPIFFLLCEIFHVNIIHNYLGNVMKYEYMKIVRKTYEFS